MGAVALDAIYQCYTFRYSRGSSQKVGNSTVGDVTVLHMLFYVRNTVSGMISLVFGDIHKI